MLYCSVPLSPFIFQKNFLAEKYEEGQRKNCHWGLGSQKLKLGAPGLFKKCVGTFCPPPTKLGLTRPNHQLLKYIFLPNKASLSRYFSDAYAWIHNQDCLYRNMYKFEYIAAMDLDEVIIPLNHTTWEDMMKHIKESGHKTNC